MQNQKNSSLSNYRFSRKHIKVKILHTLYYSLCNIAYCSIEFSQWFLLRAVKVQRQSKVIIVIIVTYTKQIKARAETTQLTESYSGRKDLSKS